MGSHILKTGLKFTIWLRMTLDFRFSSSASWVWGWNCAPPCLLYAGLGIELGFMIAQQILFSLPYIPVPWKSYLYQRNQQTLQIRAPQLPSANRVTVTLYQRATRLQNCGSQRPLYKMPGRPGSTWSCARECEGHHQQAPRVILSLCFIRMKPRTTSTAQCRETGIKSPNSIHI